jgi:hypothetical protein
MNKLLFSSIVSFPILFGHFTVDHADTAKYSTTAVVALVGAKISVSQKDISVEKYKRKDCPVCKGKGWYLSGDGIAKINCQYCEP